MSGADHIRRRVNLPGLTRIFRSLAVMINFIYLPALPICVCPLQLFRVVILITIMLIYTSIFLSFLPADPAFGNLIIRFWMTRLFVIILAVVLLIFPLVLFVFSPFCCGGIFLKSLSRVTAFHLPVKNALNYLAKRLF